VYTEYSYIDNAVKGLKMLALIIRISYIDALKHLQVLKRRMFCQCWRDIFGSCSSSRKVSHQWLDTL